MANDDKAKKLLDEAAQLLTEIALNRSGLTSDHTMRAMEFVAKAKKVQTVPQELAFAA